MVTNKYCVRLTVENIAYSVDLHDKYVEINSQIAFY